MDFSRLVPPEDAMSAQPQSDSPAAAALPERRAAVRYSSQLEISWRLFGTKTGQWWTVLVRDLSTSGIGLVFPFALKSGALLVVQIQTDRTQVERPLLTRVEHVTPQPNGTWLAGCRFVRKLSEAELQSLL
jgi:hypothetical protein